MNSQLSKQGVPARVPSARSIIRHGLLQHQLGSAVDTGAGVVEDILRERRCTNRI